MTVRFIRSKSFQEIEHRMSYELVSNEIVPEYDEVCKKYCMCYHTKLLGYVNADLLEVAEETDLPAINVFIKLTNSPNNA